MMMTEFAFSSLSEPRWVTSLNCKEVLIVGHKVSRPITEIK